MKQCNECLEYKPDNSVHFQVRLKTGGKWGTTAKCRDCMGTRRRVNRRLRKLAAMCTHNPTTQEG